MSSFNKNEKKHIDNILNGTVSYPMIPKHELTLDICMTAVKKDVMDFVTVPDQFKNQEMCDLVVCQNIHLFKYVPDKFKTDELCKTLLELNRKCYNMFPDDIQRKYWMYNPLIAKSPQSSILVATDSKNRNKKMCIDAVEIDATMLQYVPKCHIDDVFAFACEKHPGKCFLEFLGATVCTPKIYLMACKNNAMEYKNVPKNERTKEISIIVVKQNPSMIALVPQPLLTIVYNACVSANNYDVLAKHMPACGFADAKICEDLVSRDAEMLEHIPDAHKSVELVEIASKTAITHCITNPHDVKRLSCDVLTEKTCIDLVKANPEILRHLPERYRTEEVCLNAFLKNRSIVYSIPNGARMPEMWVQAIEEGNSKFDDVPIDRITPAVVSAHAKKYVVDLDLLAKDHRDVAFPILLERLVESGSAVKNIIKSYGSVSSLNKFVEYLLTHQSLSVKSIGKKVNLFQFVGIELTGEQVNKLATENGLKLVKLTNQSEKHRTIQYKDGEICDDKPFSIKEEASAGGLYCTTQCKEKNWLDYNNSGVGAMCWRRPVTFKPNARVYVESGYKIKCDSFILGKRETL